MMPHVVVLATGGTIASADDGNGAAVASRAIADLLPDVQAQTATLETRDLLKINSYLLTHQDLRIICEQVLLELEREEVDAVVLTHGTDTMEETAFLLDLVHSSPKPVVLTGAQHAADSVGADGPENLRQAISVAANPVSRARGVMICFAGQIFAARGTRKVHTLAPAPFRTAQGGPIGHFAGEQLRFHTTPDRVPALDVPSSVFDATRVDVVAAYPGADAALAQAAVDAGATGVIIAGTGLGNGNHALVRWVESSVTSGISVGLSTRAAEGPVLGKYGNGGGKDMVNAGALPYGALPLYQSRLLAAYLLSCGTPPTAASIAPYI